MQSEQKTEYPTRKRLEDERKKGNVPISKEFTIFLMILGYTVVFGLFLPNSLKIIFIQLKDFYDVYNEYLGDDYLFISISLLVKTFSTLFYVVCFLMFLSISANVIQTGFVISLKSISPSLEKISIRKGLKRLFSVKSVIETLFAGVKFTILVIVIFIVMKDIFPFTMNFHTMENNMLINFIYDNLLYIFITFTICAGFIGVLDLLYKNYSYINSLKMSKQDLKDELKNTEGNQEIKSKLKNIRKNIIKNNIRKNVKESDVIITNPTHYAVALKYDEATMPSPKVVAKGQNLVALSIKEIALENKITVIENKSLAQSLYNTVKIGDFIKEEHYIVVAEIISYIYRNRQ